MLFFEFGYVFDTLDNTKQRVTEGYLIKDVVSELFSAKLDLRGINTVSDVTSSNNVNVTRLISSDGVEFNIICDLTPISNHIVEVNDNK